MAERDWADKRASDVLREWVESGHMVQKIASELRRVRAEALEEAAKVCDAMAEDAHDIADSPTYEIARECRTRISALAKQEPKR